MLLAAAGALRTGPIRATLFASAAGVSLAATASMVKLTSDDLVNHGVVYTATDWPGYALALGTAVGVILQQVAFTSGRLPVAATAMTIANPLVGTVLAVVGFSEALPSTAGGLAGLAFGAALVCVGVYVLAHSPLLAEPLPRPGRARRRPTRRRPVPTEPTRPSAVRRVGSRAGRLGSEPAPPVRRLTGAALRPLRDRLPLPPGREPGLVVGGGDAERRGPKKTRRGGCSASTTARIAARVRAGSPGAPTRGLRASCTCLAVLLVRRQPRRRRPRRPAQSVANPPGSISVTWMPNWATSWASAWLMPSSAHLDAW